MSSTTTDQQHKDTEPALQEPHFDEEATLLSARPVVPLAAVEAARAKSSFPRPWLLGLGLVGALVVGISATVIFYSRPSGNDSNSFQDTEIAAGVEGKSTEPADGFGGTAAPRPRADIDSPAQVKRETPVGNQSDRAATEQDKKPRARLIAVIRDGKSNNHTEEESREDRKAARKQARQERRRAEREKRDGKPSDELLRIRDIFEGSPRP